MRLAKVYISNTRNCIDENYKQRDPRPLLKEARKCNEQNDWSEDTRLAQRKS